MLLTAFNTTIATNSPEVTTNGVSTAAMTGPETTNSNLMGALARLR